MTTEHTPATALQRQAHNQRIQKLRLVYRRMKDELEQAKLTGDEATITRVRPDFLKIKQALIDAAAVPPEVKARRKARQEEFDRLTSWEEYDAYQKRHAAAILEDDREEARASLRADGLGEEHIESLLNTWFKAPEHTTQNT